MSVEALHWQHVVVAVRCQPGFVEVLQLKMCKQLLGAAHTVYVKKGANREELGELWRDAVQQEQVTQSQRGGRYGST